MTIKRTRILGICCLLVAAGLAGGAPGCGGSASTGDFPGAGTETVVDTTRETVGRSVPESASEPAGEAWYVIKISGSPVGFASESVRALPDGRLHRSHMDMTLSRMGTRVSMFMAAEEAEDASGRPRSMGFKVKASSIAVEIEGVLDGDTLRLETTSLGFENVQHIAWEQGAMGQAAGESHAKERLRAGEKEFSYRTFDPQSASFKTIRVKRIEADAQEIDGRLQQPVVYEQYEDDSNIPVSTTWLDESFDPVRTVFKQLGMEIVLERVTTEQVVAIELEPNFDIIRQSMIFCDGYPPDPAALADVTLRLRFERPADPAVDFEGPNQKVLARGEDWIDILLTRETVNRTVEPVSGLKAYLGSDRFIQSEHPSIRAVADSLRAETKTDTWLLARSLARWVNGFIADKNFAMGFASALEVLEAGAGDCTEHSVLLTALLRAAGIPARPAVGFAYTNGAFVGHMWTEAYVEYWRSLDALDLNTDPRRIRVSVPKDGGAVSDKDLIQAYNVVGGMRVSVIDYHFNQSR